MLHDKSVATAELAGVRVLAALNGVELFGHERGNIEVFKTLRNLGAEVRVGVNAAPANDVDVELRRLGFDTFALPFSNQWSLQWLRRYPGSVGEKLSAVLRCSRIFLRQVREWRPTHIQLGSPLAYSYLSLALARTPTPLIYRMGDCPPVDSSFNLRWWRMAMRRSSRVVANSQFVATCALDAGLSKSKLSVIYGVAPSRDIAGETDSVANTSRDDQRIAYIGAIAKHKGLLPLIEAFLAIADEFPDLCLDLVGGSRYDTELRGELNAMVEQRGLGNRVTFHGFVDDPSSWYARARLHVAPSIFEEPAANVVIEAKRAGTPSLVFPSGSLPEFIRHQVDGYVCSDKSVSALVAGLRWLLGSPDRLRLMGQAARADFKDRFAEARFTAYWAKIYGRP